ncbi:hypothetical protein NBRC116598_34580 [Pseudophaeobacter arcticus]|jgi:hypothetical protein|uniref:Group 4 capsule polysaccharide lipoprotein gfcB, YjbF n=1 Tax=Pseudophaeobacter arcticus TaxID=385492 RepID=A0ABQ0AQ66_9RHOB
MTSLPLAQPLKQAITLTSLLILAGCSTGPEEASGSIEVGRALRDAIAARRAPDPAPLQITRAFLDQHRPHLEVLVERQEVTGYMAQGLIRQDDLPGQITTWSADDGSALSFRNGLLIATRGLPGNLISTGVPVQEGLAGPAQGGERSYHLRSGDNQQRIVTLACDLSDLGAQKLEIYEKYYNTRHLQERCEGPGQTVVINDYWVDSRSQKVWKSRQWAGPETGYLRIRDLSS